MVLGEDVVGSPEALVTLFDLIDTPEQLSFQNQHFNVRRVFAQTVFNLLEGEVLVASSNVCKGFQVGKLDVFAIDGGNQIERIVAVTFLNQSQTLHEVELVHLEQPALVIPYNQGLLKLLNGRTEVAQLHVDLSLLSVDFWDVLVVEDDLVELNQSSFVVQFVNALRGCIQSLLDLLLLDLIEIVARRLIRVRILVLQSRLLIERCHDYKS